MNLKAAGPGRAIICGEEEPPSLHRGGPRLPGHSCDEGATPLRFPKSMPENKESAPFAVMLADVARNVPYDGAFSIVPSWAEPLR